MMIISLCCICCGYPRTVLSHWARLDDLVEIIDWLWCRNCSPSILACRKGQKFVFQKYKI